MFSYLEILKDQVSQTVFSKGLKVFFSGKVIFLDNLYLEDWRVYKVLGNYQSEYLVKIPILHLLLNKNNFDKAGLALSQVASCECEYFLNNGLCKHIVAVSAALEDEFITKAKTSQTNVKVIEPTNLLDQIFEVDLVKQKSKWTNSLWELFNTKNNLNHQIYEFLEIVPKFPKNYTDFLDNLILESKKALTSYESELKLLKLIEQSWTTNGKFWFHFWLKFLKDFSNKRQVEIWQKAWVKYYVGSFFEFKDVFLAQIQELSSDLKNQILEKLKNKHQNSPEIWLSFVINSKNYDWLETNLQNLDPEYLLEIVKILPEESEKIEILISNKIKTWSDFLVPDQYQNFITTMQSFKKYFGLSESYQNTYNYIKANHARKKSLLKALN
jgi:hypothetical protein